ncbi:MAG: BRO family protein [Patescibacteria group bacterium]
MKIEIIKSLISNFESYSNKSNEGVEFWLARDLQQLLGYAKWDNFVSVISKAKTACEVTGHSVNDHFADVGKTIQMPKGAQKEVPDIMLTRYACYLIAQNGDPRKEEIAFAQNYFAVQTRKFEIIEKRIQEFETDTMPTTLKKILVDKINQSLWWHVTPSDPDAYKKRGKFLASTYSQAAFYGKPNIKPGRVKILHPLCSDSEKTILKVLFPDTHQRMLLFVTGANGSDYYARRINLDAKMHKQAKKLGYDSIVLLGSTAINELVKNRKPRSIELNLCV